MSVLIAFLSLALEAKLGYPDRLYRAVGNDLPLPRIVGLPAVRETLRVDVTEWPLGTAFAFQWHADGRPIDGANEPSLVVSERLVFCAVSVTVFAHTYGRAAVAVTSEGASLVLPAR